MRSPALLILVLAVSAVLRGQAIPAGAHEGRTARVVANDKIELKVMEKGGAFASLLLKADASRTNPLWDPLRYAREKGGAANFGDSIGHFVCVDGFGPVSKEEQAAGLQGHGEAHRLPWQIGTAEKQGNHLVLTQAVTLPILHENYKRTVELYDGEQVVAVSATLESLLSFDRPVNWAEHGTIGAPFLEPLATVIDMPVSFAQTRPYEKTEKEGGLPHRLPPAVNFQWPMAPSLSGKKVEMRFAPAALNSGDHTTCALDLKRRLVWVTALNTKKHLVFGYIFRREEFPWVQTWEYYPQDGRLARGLEFSSQPYDVSRREAVSQASLFGVPSYRWLPAKGTIQAKYLIFIAQAPEGMTRVDDVRLESGSLVIEDRKAKKNITLTATPAL